MERALAARARARSTVVSPEHVRALAAVLLEADAGHVLLCRCAWCGKVRIGDEWLELAAAGSDQLRLAARLARRATHGICPGCFERVSAEVAATRPPAL